eukprot:87898-Chlamydomonas_euryale.AAC.2
MSALSLGCERGILWLCVRDLSIPSAPPFGSECVIVWLRAKDLEALNAYCVAQSEVSWGSERGIVWLRAKDLGL